MSDIKQRAEEWLMWCNEYGTLKASTRMNTDGQRIISDLLTECDKLRDKISDQTASLDAAIESGKVEFNMVGFGEQIDQTRIAAVNRCLEIIGTGGWYNEDLENAIRQHFDMEG